MRVACLLSAWSTACSLAASSVAAVETPASTSAEKPALTLVVMDPLAKELSCPCVQGYAQRDYNQLAKYLQARLGRPVEVTFSESLVKALKNDTAGRADIVIGKCSVVEYDAKRAAIALRHVAALTGKDGKTTQTGLIVVRSGDAAKNVADLQGYRVLFGPAECAEKNAAAVALLKAHGVGVPDRLEIVAGCEDGATTILELPAGEKGAAVISSYAHPLLEGCGTVPKGAIRVVGETQPVPFVAAFVSDKLPVDVQGQITSALLEAGSVPQLLLALETQQGFIAGSEKKSAATGDSSDDVKKK